MIVSHKYKFIFLKTNKTAGTSVEIALSRFCDAGDIITPISGEDELTRKNLGFPGPRNYLSPWNEYTILDGLNFLVRGKKKKKFYNHITAKKARARLGHDIWNSYYKFCIERNPWDRIVSLYYWRCKKTPRPTISEFISSGAFKTLKRKGFQLYTIDDQIAVDRILRFEELDDEIERIRHEIGLPEGLVLPKAKSKSRSDKRSYREIMGEEDRQRIEKLFSDEIALMGYEY